MLLLSAQGAARRTSLGATTLDAKPSNVDRARKALGTFER